MACVQVVCSKIFKQKQDNTVLITNVLCLCKYWLEIIMIIFLFLDQYAMPNLNS